MQHKPSLRLTSEFRKLQKLFKISHRLLKNLNSQCRIFSVKALPCPAGGQSFPEVDERGIFLCLAALLFDLSESLRFHPKLPEYPQPSVQCLRPSECFAGLAFPGCVC